MKEAVADTKMKLEFESITPSGAGKGKQNLKPDEREESSPEQPKNDLENGNQTKPQSKPPKTSEKEPKDVKDVKELPLTISQCSNKIDPPMSEKKREELQAGILSAKSNQKAEAKAEKKAVKEPKMTASKAKAKGKSKKQKKDKSDEEESNPLDSEESLTDGELPPESDDEEKKAKNRDTKVEAKASKFVSTNLRAFYICLKTIIFFWSHPSSWPSSLQP